MVGETDQKDKNESRKIAILLISLVVILLVAGLLLIPSLVEIINVHFAPGLGLKASAIIAFFIAIVVMIIFAVVSGDGLLGELQFILGTFFLFFVILWLMIAWIF